jgi:hypothetical protein
MEEWTGSSLLRRKWRFTTPSLRTWQLLSVIQIIPCVILLCLLQCTSAWGSSSIPSRSPKNVSFYSGSRRLLATYPVGSSFVGCANGCGCNNPACLWCCSSCWPCDPPPGTSGGCNMISTCNCAGTGAAIANCQPQCTAAQPPCALPGSTSPSTPGQTTNSVTVPRSTSIRASSSTSQSTPSPIISSSAPATPPATPATQPPNVIPCSPSSAPCLSGYTCRYPSPPRAAPAAPAAATSAIDGARRRLPPTDCALPHADLAGGRASQAPRAHASRLIRSQPW